MLLVSTAHDFTFQRSLENNVNDEQSKAVVRLQLACANCLERNWPAACDNIISLFAMFISSTESTPVSYY